MLNKNTKIAILAVVCIVLILVIWKTASKKKDNSDVNNTESKISYTQDNTTGEYIIYDENGQEITRVMDEAEIKIYEDNPDYDPKLPGSDAGSGESLYNQTSNDGISY